MKQYKGFREVSSRSLSRRWGDGGWGQGEGAAPACVASRCARWTAQPRSLMHGLCALLPRASGCRRSEWVHLEGEFAGIMLVVMPCRSEKSQQGVAR